ncbi:MAG: hypothetical protein IJT12_06975 [Paludibacteraceae bacterium]|nr:hypothetical protein [Paludibacteraceae bacterium]
MAKVTWAPGISTVSGALTKINKKSQHAGDEQMLLATHRTAATTSKDCNRLFLRGLKSVTRSTPVTSDEQLLRNRFAAISRAVQQRRRNLSYVATDVANFKAQKETGYKTLYQYLWHLCANEYDAQNG